MSANQSMGCQRIILLLAYVLAQSAVYADDWPQWRGPHRDGMAAQDALVPTNLPAAPAFLWRRSIGTGFSSPVVSGTNLILLDLQNDFEVAQCLDSLTGKTRWQIPFAEAFGDEWGRGPRATPIVDGDRVYVQSCMGEFRCLSMKDGQTIWRTHFETNFGVHFLGSKILEGAAIRRGHNGSSAIDGDSVFVPVGSTNGATIVCFDKMTGRVIWKAMNDETAYSSLLVATLAGRKQVIALTATGLAGVSANDGVPLWRVPIRTAANRHALTPVVLDENRVVVASHSAGMFCVQVQNSAAVYDAKILWNNKKLNINLSTPVYKDGYLYGLGAGPDFVCINAETGTVNWSEPGFGRGAKTDFAATILIKDRLLVMDESGQIFLMRASPNPQETPPRFQACGRTWSHPAYAEGRLYFRDQRELKCLVLVPTS